MNRILIVDDQIEVAEFLLELVRLIDFDGFCESNPQRALELIEESEFDVVVSDFKMPEMSGSDFYHAAIEIRPMLSERFVFLTGDLFNEQTREVIGSTGAAVLGKPFRLADVQRVLTALVRSDVVPA